VAPVRVLTTAEAAAEFHVSVRTVESWVARGQLVPAAPGLFLEQDVADVERATRRRPRQERLLLEAAAGLMRGAISGR
jgi:hypothetical protein